MKFVATIVFLLIAIGIFMFKEQFSDYNKIELGPSAIYYKGEIDEASGQKLSAALTSTKLLEGREGLKFYLDKTSTNHNFHFIVPDKDYKDESFVKDLLLVSAYLPKQAGLKKAVTFVKIENAESGDVTEKRTDSMSKEAAVRFSQEQSTESPSGSSSQSAAETSK